jgi:hypothetical protein
MPNLVYVEDFALLLDLILKKLQEKPLEVKFNSKDIFGYMPPTEESLSRHRKLSKSRNSRTNKSSTNL